jgi:uncharacterized protein
MRVSAQKRRALGTKLLNLLLTFLIAYVIVLLLIRLFESQFIFFPNTPGRLAGDWHPHTLPVQDVWLTALDGTKLHAWWISGNEPKFTFLAFHGNAANITNRAPVYEFLRDTPANVLALEYRGYGKSEGSPSEAGLYQDADAAYGYLVKTQGIDPKSIISFGQSLGTAVAANLAARREVAAVILEAPFPSASVLARRFFWFLPGVHFLVSGQLDTSTRVKQIAAPLLIVHCKQDPVIPFELGQAVYEAANSPKQFLAINSYCHEESSLVAASQYRPALREFLSRIAPSTPH